MLPEETINLIDFTLFVSLISLGLNVIIIFLCICIFKTCENNCDILLDFERNQRRIERFLNIIKRGKK